MLYEMLTGRRVFTGEEVTETLAAVLMKEPDWSALPTAVPPSVVTVLRRCLQKDPKQRMRDIGDVSLALDGVLTSPASEPSVVVPATRPSRVRMLLTTGAYALVGTLVAVAILWWGPHRPAAPAGALRLSVVTPANRPVAVSGFPSRALAISSDGTQVVFMGRNMDARGQIQLQLRSLDAVAVRDIPGTAGARQPFFSPDGQWVGFFAQSEIKESLSRRGAIRSPWPKRSTAPLFLSASGRRITPLFSARSPRVSGAFPPTAVR